MKILAVLAALAACAGAPCLHAETRVEAEVQRAVAAPKRSASIAVAQPTEIRLPEAAFAEASGAPGAPRRIGFPRDVAALATSDDTAAALAWNRHADGSRSAALRVTSPGATALRLGLRVASLPPGARLRFQGTEAAAFEVDASRIPIDRPWWAPIVEGASATVAIDLPAGADASAVRLAIPQASHLVAGASTGFMAKSSSLCHLDAMCAPSWSTESKSVARLAITSGGSTFTCSGVLVADRDGSTTIPHLLTARHCVHTNDQAESIQAYWFYRSTACDSGAIDPGYRVTTHGGSLLYASTQTDTALIHLADTPPEGAIYAGWIVNGGTLGEGTPVTGLHHPAGDAQKVSHGDVRGYFNCTPSGPDPLMLDCEPTTPAASTFYAIGWTGGTIEGGSSGGGIFSDAGHYLLGQVYGGNGSCTDPAWTYAGRFDVAYEAGLSRWLGAADPTGATRHAAEAAPLYDVTDLWWNAAESGWGLSLTQHGTTVFGAWFAYDDAGAARWIVMPGGTWTDERTFAGDLYATTGPEGLGAFDPAKVVRTRVGSATIAFSADDQAVVTYTVDGISGSKAITRQPFGLPNAVAPGFYGDLWWNASESGWGLSISQQFGTLFAVWYTYDAEGKPAWYVLPGGRWEGDIYVGTLYRASHPPGRFFGGTFDPAAVTRTPVGQMAISFVNGSAASMAYTVDGRMGSKPVTRQPF